MSCIRMKAKKNEIILLSPVTAIFNHKEKSGNEL